MPHSALSDSNPLFYYTFAHELIHYIDLFVFSLSFWIHLSLEKDWIVMDWTSEILSSVLY